MTSPKKRYRRSAQSGQAIVIIALAMIGMLAFGVLAIDGGRYFDQRRIAQIAADAASLAGLYQYNHPDAGGNNNQGVLTKIVVAAQQNGIADTTGTTADADNSNVLAYWMNASGEYVHNTQLTGCSGGGTSPATTEPPPQCAQIVNDSTKTKPGGATGIKVRVFIPYRTFMGQIIGRAELTAQADGVSLVGPGLAYVPPTACGGICSVHTGGNICSTFANPALYWGGKPANNTDWGKGVFVNGYLRIEKMPNTITKDGGTGKIISVTTPQNTYDSGSEQWPNGEVPATSGPSAEPYTEEYNFYGQGASLATSPAYPFPDTVYLRPSQLAPNIPPNLPKRARQIQASFFRPYTGDINTGVSDVVDTPASLGINGSAQAVPSGNGSDNWIFKGHQLNINPSDPDAPQKFFFHYINNGTGAGAAVQNGNDFAAMISSPHNKRGIFFVDGDIDTAAVWGSGITLVATGTVHLTGGGDYGHAGVYAYNFTVLAGGTKSAIPPTNVSTSCATPADIATNYILHFDVQQSKWLGIAYVPNGLFWINTNQNNGDTGTNGPILAWSVALSVSAGHPANNFHFSNCDATCFPQPTYVMGLNQ
jgi:hypothetical protein